MSLSQNLKRDFNFILFSEIYYKVGTGKGKRVAHQLVENTIQLINKKGYQAVTAKDVVKASGLSSSQVNYYYKNIEELKLFAIKYIRYLYQKYVVNEVLSETSFEKQFNKYFYACLNWPKTYPKYTKFWLIYLSQVVDQRELKAINTKAVQIGLERLIELIQLGVEEKKVHSHDIKQTAVQIHKIISAQILFESTEDQDFQSQREWVKKTCYHSLCLKK